MKRIACMGLLATASCLAADSFTTDFSGALSPCLTPDADEGYSLTLDGTRVLARKASGGGIGTARLDFDRPLEGNFTVTAVVGRGALEPLAAVGLRVFLGPTDYVDIYFYGGDSVGSTNTVLGREDFVPVPGATATFQIERAGDDVTVRYDSGSGFQTIATDSVPLAPGPFRAEFFLYTGLVSPAQDGWFDSMDIVADSFGGSVCTCAADMNADGSVNVFDFLEFQTLFSNGDIRADLSAAFGTLNLFDFLAFQTLFGNGC